MYQFAYLIGDLIFAAVWTIFFFSRKDLRKQMLIYGFFAPLAPLADYLWFHSDYWRPEYLFSIKIGQVAIGFESLLFFFFVQGIAGVIYEVIFHKKHQFGKPRPIFAVALILFGFSLTAVFIKLGLVSIWATSFAFLITSVIIMIIYKKLSNDAIYSGVSMVLLAIIFYSIWLRLFPEAIQRFWLTTGLSGIKLWKIPIEELVWFFSAGIFGGVFYEFWLNVKKYKKV